MRPNSSGKAVTAALAAIMLFLAQNPADSEGRPSMALSPRPVASVAQGMTLPKALAFALAKVQARCRIAILLPSELPAPIKSAGYAVVDEATQSHYAISLYYKLGVGDGGFAAGFSAQAKPAYDPARLPTSMW